MEVLNIELCNPFTFYTRCASAAQNQINQSSRVLEKLDLGSWLLGWLVQTGINYTAHASSATLGASLAARATRVVRAGFMLPGKKKLHTAWSSPNNGRN
eukprot:4935490-Amphidinium_carterae.1